MKELEVCGNNNYKVYINSRLDYIQNTLKENKLKAKTKYFMIANKTLFKMYEDKIRSMMGKLNLHVFLFNEGEINKNLDSVTEIYKFLFRNECCENSVLISFGGTTVYDLTGFVASTYLGGIPYLVIPTSLNSMIDFSIRGISSINFQGRKNVISSKCEPKFVYISTSFLKTLKDKDYNNGLTEVVKLGLISTDLFEFIEQNHTGLKERENDKILYIVKECLRIRLEFLEKKKEHNIFRFGHKIGESIEEASGFSLNHGEAIALGILCSIKLSEIKLDLNKDIYLRVYKLFEFLDINTSYKVDNMEKFLCSIKHKNYSGLKNKFILLQDISMPVIYDGVLDSDIIKALNESINIK